MTLRVKDGSGILFICKIKRYSEQPDPQGHAQKTITALLFNCV